ncbi:protein kinase [Mucilaginibacter rubeus]|uniref:Protein kinase n=1 Tax=Mucilaginibacter rubeus TaxID=2027860 RepID=A0ABX7UEI9_9SPHI|nr:protein kinase [Mucilaginibacter rubeus]QTE51159.1 protein kinase [Mucilaginibacter rubeus]QTE64293.1 protein kinase [Mucilaginibacter rubeus]
MVGQFAPKYHGQFAPKQWVSLRRNGVVSFIIISNLGIYVYREPVTGISYVLKVFEIDNFNEYQEVEFQKLARLSAEPEIATVYGLVNVKDGAEPKVGYLMEYIHGKTLEEFIKTSATIGLNQYYNMIAELVTGMEKSHHYGVIHNDLRLYNVMIDAFGSVKIIDFFWDPIGASYEQDVKDLQAIEKKLFEKLAEADQKHAEIVHQYCQAITAFKGAGETIRQLNELAFELGFLTPKGKLVLAFLLHNEGAEINSQTQWLFDERKSAKRLFPELTEEYKEIAAHGQELHRNVIFYQVVDIEKRAKLHFDALLEQLNQCELIHYRLKASTQDGYEGPYDLVVFISYRIKLLKWKSLNDRLGFLEAPSGDPTFLDLVVSEEWAANPFD